MYMIIGIDEGGHECYRNSEAGCTADGGESLEEATDQVKRVLEQLKVDALLLRYRLKVHGSSVYSRIDVVGLFRRKEDQCQLT